MIPLSAIQSTAEILMAKAAIEIPEDYLGGLERLADTETGELSAFVIRAMLDNYKAAEEDRRAMCGDTGTPRWYVKYGNDARVEGGPAALETALRRATAKATHDVPLRPNRVHPLWRTDHDNNVGINAPEILRVLAADVGTVSGGGLFLEVNAGEREKVTVTFAEVYTGPLELTALRATPNSGVTI